MRKLFLGRYHYGKAITEGLLRFGSESLFTLERPWQSGAPGGLPFESCIPDGLYTLRPHERGNGDKVVALVAPELGVYYRKEDRTNGVGRYLILIHSANWVEQVVGCIAPGIVRTIAENKVMVRSSRVAVAKIMKYIGNQDAEIEIKSSCGTN